MYPAGDNHSNKNIHPAAKWTATKATMAQLVGEKGSKNAVGEMIPVFLATEITKYDFNYIYFYFYKSSL